MSEIDDHSRPQRRQPAHGVHIVASTPTIVFVTLCTCGRKPWLATPQVHQTMVDVWREAPQWLVGRYVLMPDHLHLFAALGTEEISLERWMRHWKAAFSRAHGHPECRWQTSHWDRRLRSGESYAEKWDYVRSNPVRHGLVSKAEDWPYQGELNLLLW